MYIGPDGIIHRKRPWGIQRIIGLFWAIVNFFVLFFRTMLNLDQPGNSKSYGGGRGSGNGGPGSGPRGPGGPRRRMGTIQTLPECNIPGGG